MTNTSYNTVSRAVRTEWSRWKSRHTSERRIIEHQDGDVDADMAQVTCACGCKHVCAGWRTECSRGVLLVCIGATARSQSAYVTLIARTCAAICAAPAPLTSHNCRQLESGQMHPHATAGRS